MTRIPVWLDTQWQRLQDGVRDGRLGHAILLTGPQGVGKSILAAELKKLVLCAEHKVPACGHCRSCQVAAAGNHPDVHILEVLEDKTAILVEQVRELVEALTYTPTYASHKIALIRPAEKMNQNSFNALLKTLEEPPGDTLLVLLSHSASKLPATIISRCQAVHCGVPNAAVAAKWLNEQTGEGDWEVSLELAGGAPFQAIDYKKQGVNKLFASIIEDLLGLNDGSSDLVAVAQEWNRAHLALRLVSLYKLLRLLTLHKCGLEGELAHKSGFSSLHKVARDIKLSTLLGYQHKVVLTIAGLDSQLNSELMLDDLLAPWVHGFNNYQLETLER
ncbi:MAG: DNA polymerase III subunit delta' [Gammaproteobacteria bacterium]|nr:DNA polymerase III subunit delta' [Gammaproteobacteria bacterium]